MTALCDLHRTLPPGTIFRFRSGWPYESMVDFMLFQQPGAGCGLIVTTGLKAGFVAVILPDEANAENAIGVPAAWLAANWTRWVWPEGDPASVTVIEGYPAPLPG